MRKNILSFSKVFLIVVLFIINGFFVNFVFASTTVNITVSGGADVSDGIQSVFTASEIAKLGTSDDDRIQSNAISWPNNDVYDENNYIEFLFSPTIPSNAIIENVSISHEFYRTGAMTEAKLEVWDGLNFVDQILTTGTTSGTAGEHTDIIDVSSFINTPDKVNNIKIRFLAYRNNNANTKTSHDFISISVTYSIPVKTVGLTIRSGNTVIFSGTIILPTPGTINLNDNTGTPHSVNTQSVLSILNEADILSPDFSISNLQYYGPFDLLIDPLGSLYLKCITDSIGNNCNNWQYAVNNLYPSVGMDKTILSGGEIIYVYFGPQNRVVLNPGNINTNDTLTVTAQKYDYQNNVWLSRTTCLNTITNQAEACIVGLTQPDPNNPFSPIEVKTSAVDTNGQVIFSSTPAGSYNVGVKEDFYFPTETLTVITSPPAQTGGGGGGYTPPTFNVTNAIAYLKSVQTADGSFGGSDLYTDWVAIAYGAGNVSDSSRDTLLSYLNSRIILSSLLTDNERRAMALLALKQNPYSFNGVNYIETITKSFDGTQFGDSSLVNDDIFALIPLTSTGYTINDEIIAKDIAFIISKQKPDGSWEESADLTGAVIQVLKSFEPTAGISDALSKAINYLSNGQNNDGGWNSVSSTSWAMQGASALGLIWTKNGQSGLNYLANAQMGDGGVLSSNETLQNRIWATSYAIPAILGKPWNVILHRVPKPTPVIVAMENNMNKNDEKVTNNITNNKEEEEVIASLKSISTPKKEAPQIISENIIEEPNLLVASVQENQTPKAFVKILFLPALLLLVFLLGRVWIRLQVRL